MKILPKLALLAALTLFAPAAAQKPEADNDWGSDYTHQGERIISYVSDVTVDRDSRLRRAGPRSPSLTTSR